VKTKPDPYPAARVPNDARPRYYSPPIADENSISLADSVEQVERWAEWRGREIFGLPERSLGLYVNTAVLVKKFN